MKCSRCGERGAERLEMTFETGSTVILYLCVECREEAGRDETIQALSAAPAA